MEPAVILPVMPNLTEPVFASEQDDADEESGALLQMEPITLKLTPDVCGERMDKVISKLIPQFSRSRIQQWIAAGHVSVDDKVAKTKMTSFGDETVVVSPQPAPEDDAYTAEAMDLAIVHEDATI